MSIDYAKAYLTEVPIERTRSEVDHWMISIEKPRGTILHQMKIVPTSQDHHTPKILLHELVDSFNRRYEVESLETELRSLLQKHKPLEVDKVETYVISTQSKGGRARSRSLTPERRKEISRKAANARWKKRK